MFEKLGFYGKFLKNNESILDFVEQSFTNLRYFLKTITRFYCFISLSFLIVCQIKHLNFLAKRSFFCSFCIFPILILKCNYYLKYEIKP